MEEINLENNYGQVIYMYYALTSRATGVFEPFTIKSFGRKPSSANFNPVETPPFRYLLQKIPN
jgi:hypothetical protein